MTGAAGATLSSVNDTEAVLVLPAPSVSLAVMVCEPWGNPVGVTDHVPLAFAVVVPTTVVPSRSVMRHSDHSIPSRQGSR